MRPTLPEETLLAGWSSGLSAEPVSLLASDEHERRDFEKARQVYSRQERFTAGERDRIIARLLLGL